MTGWRPTLNAIYREGEREATVAYLDALLLRAAPVEPPHWAIELAAGALVKARLEMDEGRCR